MVKLNCKIRRAGAIIMKKEKSTSGKVLSKKKNREGIAGYMIAGIPVLGFVIFGLFPLVVSLIVSFTELHIADLSQMKFVGWDNYIEVFTTKETYATYLSTIIYALNVPIGGLIALYLANKMYHSKVGMKFFRFVFFIPYVSSSVVVAMIFGRLYSLDTGVLNSILTNLGFEKVGWLTDSPMSFMISAIFMDIWNGIGYNIVLYLAALAKVDNSYYEAAKMDGATPAQIFWKITWPAVSPTTSVVILFGMIGSLQQMASTHILASGVGSIMPRWPGLGTQAWVSDLVVKRIYNLIFAWNHLFGYGSGSAAGWILAIIIFVSSQLMLKLQKKWVCYDF